MDDGNTTTATDNGIQVTSDYEQFRLMDANREQNRFHVEALKTAFGEMGNLTRVQPILVNENMEIIDGQHRFVACKELGEPIYYTQVPGLGIADARQMNILHKNWQLPDYAHSYAAGGNANYQRFLQLLEEHEFNYSITLYYCAGGDVKGAFRDFRHGEFTLSEDGMRQATQKLDKLAEIAEMNPIASTGPFGLAYLQAMTRNAEFDHARFISRLERSPQLLTRQAGTPEYLRVIEDIYNHNMNAENRVRLF